MKQVVVIGAGLGGLAAAAVLAHQGLSVTVLEKNDAVGGKMGSWTSGGYRFDTGPTLLTMPFVARDLFASVGKDPDTYLRLTPVEPVCRYFYPDGSQFDACSDTNRLNRELVRFAPADAPGFQRFLEHGEDIYRATAEPFLFSPFGSWNVRSLWKSLRHLPVLTRLDAFRTLDEVAQHYVRDPRLQQLINRFATYNGSSPFRAPATLALIPSIEFGMGGWYVQGGMYELARALERLARECGATIRTDSPVRRILDEKGGVTGVETSEGEIVRADVVVCNADALYARQYLFPERMQHRAQKAEPSLAGFVMMLGVDCRYPMLAHHNVFFSRDYRLEFASLVEKGIPADEPTVYVSISAISDPGMAPEGHSNMFILVNAPALDDPTGNAGSSWQWSSHAGEYRNRILDILENRGLTGLRRHIVTEHMITPENFQRRYNAFRGSIYGLASNTRWSAFLRPPNRVRGIRGLYLAGGSTHPGGGIPLVLLSGKLAAGLVLEDRGTA